jgi:hypothetical protein
MGVKAKIFNFFEKLKIYEVEDLRENLEAVSPEAIALPHSTAKKKHALPNFVKRAAWRDTTQL